MEMIPVFTNKTNKQTNKCSQTSPELKEGPPGSKQLLRFLMHFLSCSCLFPVVVGIVVLCVSVIQRLFSLFQLYQVFAEFE